LVQISSGAIVVAPCSLGTKGLQLNHTRSMSVSDLELQYDQASAVLPIIQRKYSNIALPFFNLLHMWTKRYFKSPVPG
jgi:hypothetical protein